MRKWAAVAFLLVAGCKDEELEAAIKHRAEVIGHPPGGLTKPQPVLSPDGNAVWMWTGRRDGKPVAVITEQGRAAGVTCEGAKPDARTVPK